MIIAIDGPAAAGKSTVARRVAERLGLAFLDTGAMYRAVTHAVLEQQVDPTDAEGCGRVASSIELGFDADGALFIDGRLAEPLIRTSAVSRAVSHVSAHPGVRAAVVPLQRSRADQPGRLQTGQINPAEGQSSGIVAEGRDTTTVVFPDADYKFFLIATSNERAKRRAAQLEAPERYEEIREAIERRDHLDASRPDSPLKQAPDAILIETDELDVDGVVEAIVGRVRAVST